jgi:uroporphyrinogen-III synthase
LLERPTGVRILVTRVHPQAQRWVEQFSRVGMDALALPLIEIHAVPDPQPLRQAWTLLPGCAAVMFVSVAAVEHFFSEKPVQLTAGSDPVNTRHWCTGPGSRQALLAAGVAQAGIDAPDGEDAQFDSEALWRRVQTQIKAGDHVLIVRGGDARAAGLDSAGLVAGVGRDWLAQQLSKAGAQVHWLMAYQRSGPLWSAAQSALASGAAQDGSIWLFSSSEALAKLKALLPEQDWTQARAVVTHQRIGQAAQALGFSDVRVAKPLFDDVLGSIKSFS